MRPGKAAIALLLIGLVLLLDAMAACHDLHEKIHKDADQPGHECAVTMFAHGKVDSATVDVPIVGTTAAVEATPQIEFSLFSPAIENLPHGRAPPALCSVS
jgi:ABC-type phosphate/phosphonate transport system substrate-binding protein